MVDIAADGFALGLSLILAIGSQNAFVLRQGLRRSHVLAVVLTCAISDAMLIAIGVTSFTKIADMLPWISPVLLVGGAAFLIVYGAIAFRSAVRGGNALLSAEGVSDAFWPTIVTCLLLTWANPHVYLDTVVLLGSVASRYGPDAVWFGAGAVLSSFVFFFSLGFGARVLAPFFARPAAWRVLDLGVALVMWAIAAKLLLEIWALWR
ncbi:MAG: LysE/ArgO family amino acid transporter [Pseudomonadota bacterium]